MSSLIDIAALVQQGQHQNAYDALQLYLADHPDEMAAYYQLALLFSKWHRLEEAKHLFESLLDLSPGHPGCLFQLGCLAMQRGDYSHAIPYFQALDSSLLGYAESRANLATCYLKLGDLDHAKQYYLESLTYESSDTQVLYNLGVIAMSMNQVKEAIQYYLRVVSLDNNEVCAHQNVGSAYLMIGDRNSALAHFREVARLMPGDLAIAHILKILNQDLTLAASPPIYIQSLFDAYADHFEAHVLGALDYQVPRLMFDTLSQLVSLPDRAFDVLDMGCGSGLCGEAFQSVAKTLTGVDLSSKMLAIAAHKACYDRLIQSDIVPFLKNHPEAYDLIIAGDVMVYYGDLSDVFQAVFRSLKPNGLFVMNVEKGGVRDFVMSAGRFLHSSLYVERIALASEFRVLLMKEVTLRTQNHEPVKGELGVFRRPISIA